MNINTYEENLLNEAFNSSRWELLEYEPMQRMRVLFEDFEHEFVITGTPFDCIQYTQTKLDDAEETFHSEYFFDSTPNDIEDMEESYGDEGAWRVQRKRKFMAEIGLKLHYKQNRENSKLNRLTYAVKQRLENDKCL